MLLKISTALRAGRIAPRPRGRGCSLLDTRGVLFCVRNRFRSAHSRGSSADTWARARAPCARRRARQRCLAARHGRGPRHRRPGGRLRRHGRADADQFLAARLRGLVLGAAGLRRARRRRHETRRGSSATWRLASATSRAASTAAATGTRRIRRCRRPRRPCRREAAHNDDRNTPPSRTARPRGSPGSCRGARKVCDGISTRWKPWKGASRAADPDTEALRIGVSGAFTVCRGMSGGDRV